MSADYSNILSPIGIVSPQQHKTPRLKRDRAKPVVGLLDNSKPNAALFLEGIAAKLRENEECDVVTIAKPRSAAACAELDAIAARCDVVINAVAD
jgi:hypothetical protein